MTTYKYEFSDSYTVNLDTLLALILPLSLLFIGYRLLPFIDFRSLVFPPKRKQTSANGPFSLASASKSFSNYSNMAQADLESMHRSYNKLGRAHQRIGLQLGYPNKLEQLQQAVSVNSVLTRRLHGLAQNQLQEEGISLLPVNRVDGNLMRVREVLKHFVRDWAEEGKRERQVIFEPILDLLRQHSLDKHAQSVLVPGCGLGRLAWEISEIGFNTTANDVSYFMTLALRFLLSPTMTTKIEQHTVQPYAHWFSHQRNASSIFRNIKFPDAIPRLSEKFRLLEEDFTKLSVSKAGRYNFIVTLFFIDTSLNVIETIEKIYHLLEGGGIWINCGPLLWTGGAQAKIELSLEEVMSLAKMIGFVFDASPKSLACEYTADRNAMMKWMYEAQLWAARKPV